MIWRWLRGLRLSARAREGAWAGVITSVPVRQRRPSSGRSRSNDLPRPAPRWTRISGELRHLAARTLRALHLHIRDLCCVRACSLPPRLESVPERDFCTRDAPAASPRALPGPQPRRLPAGDPPCTARAGSAAIGGLRARFLGGAAGVFQLPLPNSNPPCIELHTGSILDHRCDPGTNV